MWSLKAVVSSFYKELERFLSCYKAIKAPGSPPNPRVALLFLCPSKERLGWGLWMFHMSASGTRPPQWRPLSHSSSRIQRLFHLFSDCRHHLRCSPPMKQKKGLYEGSRPRSEVSTGQIQAGPSGSAWVEINCHSSRPRVKCTWRASERATPWSSPLRRRLRVWDPSWLLGQNRRGPRNNGDPRGTGELLSRRLLLPPSPRLRVRVFSLWHQTIICDGMFVANSSVQLAFCFLNTFHLLQLWLFPPSPVWMTRRWQIRLTGPLHEAVASFLFCIW